MTDRPLCKCHGEPMVSPKNWQCRVKSRERNRRNAEKYDRTEYLARYMRERYDNDPVFRIERNLRRCEQYRAEAGKRRKEKRGEVSLEG